MKLKFLLILLLGIIMVACAPKANATALPTVALSNSSQPTNKTTLAVGSGVVSASGFIVPSKEARMAFIEGGILKIVNFEEGDLVQPGQVLAELDNSAIRRDLEQSQRNLKELTSLAAQAAAAQALAVARQALKDQQDKVDSQFFRRASDTLIEKTQGEIELAKQALARASDSYRLVARLDDGDNRKATALVAMTNAQLRLNELLAKYNWYSGKPSDIDAALANAKLDAAKAALQEAEWYLDVLKGSEVPPEATGGNLARLEAVKASISEIQERLDHSRLLSPITGVVVKVNVIPGEIVSPGVVLFIISDVAHLRVETTDLSERDVPRVVVGQKVTISIKALNKNTPGHVISISPLADTLGGDVVYKTTIEMDSPPAEIRAGMSVDVQYETK